MTEPYYKECKYCKKTILMSEETGKWIPYNQEGSAHDCRNNAKGSEQNHKEITLEQVRKKLESIGITIDLDKLMGQ